MPESRLRIFDKFSVLPISVVGGEAVSKNGIVSGAMTLFVGTGLAVLVDIKLTSENVTLLASSPLISSMSSMGWDPDLRGHEPGENLITHETRSLSELVHDAILTGQVVVVVDSRSAEETSKVSQLIQASIGDSADVM